MGIGLNLDCEELGRKPIPSTPEHYSIERAWRALCADMLAQAILCSTGSYRPPNCKGITELKWAKEEAIRWLEGGPAVVTFDEACEGAGVDPAFARDRVKEWRGDPVKWRQRRRWKSGRG